MFRFIHAADLHLDSPLRGLEAHEGAPVDQLRAASRRALENLVGLAIEERVDFVLIAGDIYDGNWKDYSTGLYFRGQMVRLHQVGIRVVIIAGNHDAASVVSKKLSLPENVRVLSTQKAETYVLDGLPVAVHGRGFPQRAVPENLAVDYPSAMPDVFNIGLLHTSLTGRPGHDRYAPCTEADLVAKDYDYWALGHIHQPEIISTDPHIVFPGNIQGRHVRETGERGCYLVTVDDKRQVAEMNWQVLDVVRWNIVQVDVSGLSAEAKVLGALRRALSEAVEAASGRRLAVRVVLSGATSLHGALHRDAQQWRAEVQALAQDMGEQWVWLEKLKINTSPLVDLQQLAERDDLTRIVLEGLEDAREGMERWPAAIDEMVSVLPADLQAEMEAEWDTTVRTELLGDVRAIILDALEQGGEEGA